MTQHDRIEKYIRTYGSITPMQAFADLGITKLASRISEMKRNGYCFDQEYVESENRFGEKVHYMRYSFPSE